MGPSVTAATVFNPEASTTARAVTGARSGRVEDVSAFSDDQIDRSELDDELPEVAVRPARALMMEASEEWVEDRYAAIQARVEREMNLSRTRIPGHDPNSGADQARFFDREEEENEVGSQGQDAPSPATAAGASTRGRSQAVADVEPDDEPDEDDGSDRAAARGGLGVTIRAEAPHEVPPLSLLFSRLRQAQ
jgi:hypothetical protein